MCSPNVTAKSSKLIKIAKLDDSGDSLWGFTTVYGCEMCL